MLDGFYHLTPTDAWHLIKLHEISEISRQISDLEFADLLNRVRVIQQTQSDITAIHTMADTDISHLPENHFRSYVINHLLAKQNVEVMNNATNTIFTVHAVHGKEDGQTGTFQYNLSDDIDIKQIENLKEILKLWVGARVQLTDNLDVEDKLCNGSEGTLKYIHIRTTTSSTKNGGAIYV